MEMKSMFSPLRLIAIVGMMMALAACSPTVKVEVPDKPIEINMNVNIKHEILVKVEKQVDEILDDDELF